MTMGERFAVNLRAKREEHGLSVWSLAVKSGVKPWTILRYEKGEAKLGPTLEAAILLAGALECPIEELIGEA